jgi:uncharacterized protein
MAVFEFSSSLPDVPAEVFKWHMRPGAFERLNPPWTSARAIDRQGTVREGGRVTLRLGRLSGLKWILRHTDIVEGRAFADEQVHGPFRAWRHVHSFIPDGTGCTVHDRIEYKLPLGRLGELLGGQHIHDVLVQTFRYRHLQLQHDLARHRIAAGMPPQHIAISGASGLIGMALCDFLTSGGHHVRRLVRRMVAPGSADIHWNPALRQISPDELESTDVVINLSGESLARRWTPRRKAALLNSRVQSTEILCQTLASLSRKPRVVISASAIGYYGDRGEEELREDSRPGTGFLADLCRAWEAAAEPARQADIRVVHPRIGLVLSGRGGALPPVLRPFRWGLGGPIGAGRQYLSWIDIDDLLGAMHLAMFQDDLRGPMNAVSSNPITNRRFSQTLAKVIRRPALVRAPAVAVRLALGEFADATLLASQRALPEQLSRAGFCFFHGDLEACLRHQLGYLKR